MNSSVESTTQIADNPRFSHQPMMMTPGEFKRYVESEFVLNASLAKKAGLKAQ